MFFLLLMLVENIHVEEVLHCLCDYKGKGRIRLYESLRFIFVFQYSLK